MRWTKARRATIHIEVPDADWGPRQAEAWAVLTEFGREVFMCAHPGKQDRFDGALAEFRSNPQRVVTKGRLRPKVGMGVDLALDIPYVLPLVTLVVGIAAERVTGGAVDVVGRATRRRIQALLTRRQRGGGDETVAESAEDSCTQSAAPAPTPEVTAEANPAQSNPVQAGGLPAPLDLEEELALHDVLVARAVDLGMNEDKARHLAEAVIGALRLRSARAR
ncbi:hypothetical protein ACFWSF_40405 [Streptomyces sp. NPDC058611]|uniref:hypothetical protein n=1 Tax=unclassified Streptomyces TaxID=2593676 RepID=UPI003661DC40